MINNIIYKADSSITITWDYNGSKNSISSNNPTLLQEALLSLIEGQKQKQQLVYRVKYVKDKR